MSWKDRIAAEAAKARDRVGGPRTPEELVLALVRWARDPDDEELSAKEVRKDARKRRRRLGIAAFAAGPFAGVAGETTDLYSDTATVCDLVDLHDLELSDLEVGGHMLVLWGVTDELAAAHAALGDAGPPIATLLHARFKDRLHEEMPDEWTLVSTVKFLWRVRGLRGDIADAAGAGAFKRVLRAGAQTKDFVARAEAQLGVS